MPTLWDTAKERKLLLAIIELTNPKPPSWQDVQHFQKIKKQTKDGTSEPSTPRKPSVATNKTPTSGKSTGSRKRKQAESLNATNEDDEEPSLPYLKKGSAGRAISVDGNGSPKRMKTEKSLQNGPVCKTEELTEDGAVDLVDDALYD